MAPRPRRAEPRGLRPLQGRRQEGRQAVLPAARCWHDTVMSLVVVCVIIALAASGTYDADGIEAGILGPWYTEPADPGTTELRPAAGLVLLLPLLPPADLQVAGDGRHRDGRHPDDLPDPPHRPSVLRPAPRAAAAHRPVAMVAAVLTILSMAVLTWKGATAKEALGSELIARSCPSGPRSRASRQQAGGRRREALRAVRLPELPHLSRAGRREARRARPLGGRRRPTTRPTSSSTSRTRRSSGTR